MGHDIDLLLIHKVLCLQMQLVWALIETTAITVHKNSLQNDNENENKLDLCRHWMNGNKYFFFYIYSNPIWVLDALCTEFVL